MPANSDTCLFGRLLKDNSPPLDFSNSQNDDGQTARAADRTKDYKHIFTPLNYPVYATNENRYDIRQQLFLGVQYQLL